MCLRGLGFRDLDLEIGPVAQQEHTHARLSLLKSRVLDLGLRWPAVLLVWSPPGFYLRCRSSNGGKLSVCLGRFTAP